MDITHKIWKYLKGGAAFFGIKLDAVRVARFIAKAVYRKKRIWVFGSWYGEKYADNSRYFYEYVIKYHPEITPIWVTKNSKVFQFLKKKKYRCYLIRSFQWLLALVSGEAFFFSASARLDFDFNKRWSFPSALLIQLWHGMPIKHIGRQEEKGENRIYHDDLVIATSSFTQKTLEQAFGHDSTIVKITGLPRNDALFDRKDIEKLRTHLEIPRNAKIILYLPTFRDNDIFFGVHASMIIQQIMDSERHKEILNRYGAILLIKSHFCVEKEMRVKKIEGKNEIRLISLDESTDVSGLLKITDVLITDYSSCYIDYLLLGRPVIFYQYDLEEYQRKSRGFYYSLDEICAGHRAFNIQQLADCLEAALSGKDGFYKEREKMLAFFHTYRDNSACERVFNNISEKLKKR